MSQILISEKQNRILNLTLNRPEKKNALNAELISALKAELRHAATASDVKVIIIKAAGDVFSSGADLESLQAMQQFSFEQNLADSNHLRELLELIYLHPKIIIAQIHGHAIAGGCGLATVCDFSFAAEEAKFGYTEVGIGFIPALVSAFLIRKIGEGKARELLLTGKLVTASEAVRFGLINEVLPNEMLSVAVNSFAEKLIANVSSNSISATKRLINDVQNVPLNESLNTASKMNAETRSSNDCKHGIQSFLTKNKPSW